MYRMLIRWLKSRLHKKLADDAVDSSIHGPEAYLRNKIADETAGEVAFWGNSTPGMRAASRYR